MRTDLLIDARDLLLDLLAGLVVALKQRRIRVGLLAFRQAVLFRSVGVRHGFKFSKVVVCEKR